MEDLRITGVVGALKRRHAASPTAKESFREAVVNHGLAGLAVRAADLGSLDLTAPDEAYLRKKWSAARRKTAVVNLEARRLGRAALEGINRREIKRPILLKGESVACRYTEPAVRCYNDIDLLIDLSDAAWWGTRLNGLGYRPQNRWRERNSLRFDKHVEYRRPVSDGEVLCDLHVRLSHAKPLRAIGYATFEGHTEPARAPGLLQLTHPAQLLMLAVHLAQHPRGRRRLIWYQDFLELGDPRQVEAARIAEEAGFEQTLEWALSQVEECIGHELWNARKIERLPGSLATALERDVTGLRFHMTLARQLGPSGAIRYLLSKFDPRRLAGPQGHLPFLKRN